MTVLTRTPENTNYLQPTKYLLTFDRINSTQYFCQTVNIPGLTMPKATLQSPLHNYHIAGLNLDYNELAIEFTIDEDVQSWRNIYNWFLAISSPHSFDERNKYQNIQNRNNFGDLKSYSDATLTILSNLNNPLLKVKFIDAFPTSLSDISFDTKNSADTILTATATFAFEYYEFVD